jgi:four helix bundle protein
MERAHFDIADRLVGLSVHIVSFVNSLPRSIAGRHLSGQLLRCGTAPGAHYGEASAAESRRDFIHKMKIGLKELRESKYWVWVALEVFGESRAVDSDLLQELDELCGVFYASIRTAQKNLKKAD